MTDSVNEEDINPQPDPAVESFKGETGMVGQRLAQVTAEIEQLRAQLKQNDDEIDALQISMIKANQPWYKDASTIVALFALLLSLTTTLFAFRQQEQQRVRDARIELRTLLQRISDFPKENLVIQQTFSDPRVQGQLGGILQQQNALLAKQAEEIMRLLPKRYVSSSEYIILANAMWGSNQPNETLRFLHEAESVVRDYNDGLSIYQLEGQLYFFLGDLENGREAFQKALDIFKNFQLPNTYIEAQAQTLTYMYWAAAESGRGQCDQARELIELAQEKVAQSTMPGVENTFEKQVLQTKQSVDLCQPITTTETK